MKKKLAALLAVLCVMGTGAALPAVTSVSAPVNSIIASAAATTEIPLPGVNADKYKYPYADTSRYTTTIAAVSGTEWKANDNTYSIYKITITSYDDAGKKITVATEYKVGLKLIKNTSLDVVASETVKISDAIMSAFDTVLEKDMTAIANAEVKEGKITKDDVTVRVSDLKAQYAADVKENKVTVIADNAFKGSYLKTIDLTGIEYIGKSAFQSCQYITEIEIPASVKFVGDSAFASSGLKTLKVNNEMPVIPASFCTATNLTSISFAHPELIRTVGDSAFKNTPVEKPIFQDWGTAAGYEPLILKDSAYEGCTSIQTVTMSDNVYEFGKNTFKGCTSMTDLTFGKTMIGADAGSFEGCIALKNIKFNDVLQALGGGAFKNCTALEEVTGLPDTLTDWVPYGGATGWGFGNSMFSGCTSLKSVEYPKNVTQILDGAFSGCVNLSTVYKDAKNKKAGLLSDDTIVLVDESAFEGCVSLQTVNYPNAVRLGKSAFSGCTGIESFKVGVCKKATIDEKTEYPGVGANALEGCTGLKEIELLSDSYGNAVFKDCSNAAKITINSDKMDKTPDAFFSGCSVLTEVLTKTIPADAPKMALSEVAILSPKTFENCTALEEINLPALRILEDSAFAGCTALRKISNSGNDIKAEDYGTKCFFGCENLTFTVSGDIYTIGASAFQKSGIKAVDIQGMSGGTVVIGASAFADCAALEKASILSGDAAKFSVGASLFAGDTALESAVYEGNQITASMFKNCSAMTKICTNATSIKANAFEGCTALLSVRNINDSGNIIAADVAANAFKGCESLLAAPVNKETVFDGIAQFSGCSTLQSVEVGKLTASMFENCTSLSDVQLEGVSDVPDKAFQNCTGLKEINLDLRNLGNIGTNAFAGSGLTKATITNGVNIKPNAFAGCLALEEVTADAAKVDKSAFQNDVALKHVTLSTDSIGNTAFSGCTSLTAEGLQLKNTDAHTLTEIGTNAFSGCDAMRAAVVPGSPTLSTKAFGYDAKSKVRSTFYMVGEKGSTVEEYAKANNLGFATSLADVPENPEAETKPVETESTPVETESKTPVDDVIKGDVDTSGKVDILDVITINRAILGKDKLNDKQKIAADVDGSGETDSTDSLMIMKFIVGLLTEF